MGGKLAEFLVLFVILPTAFSVLGDKTVWVIIPALWLANAYCWWILRGQTVVPPSRPHVKQVAGVMLARFFLLASVLAFIVFWVAPEMLFRLPRENPRFWLLIVVLYPLLSVIPQEYIFRRFFFARYEKQLNKHPVLFILVNALLFSFAHLVFGNWQALVLTFAGGAMFASTYLRCRSLWLVCLEHSLWGGLVFTLGLGEYFVGGTVRALFQG